MALHRSTVLASALLLIIGAAAGAQGVHRPVQNAASLLERCTSVPDEEACRAALRLPISARQRSLALTHLAESDIGLAESDIGAGDSLLLEAVALDSMNALAHVLLGSRAGRWGNAGGIRHLMRAVALRPDWRHLHRKIAMGYRAQQTAQLDTSIRLWRVAVAAEPAEPANHVGLGAVLARAERLAEAEVSFRRAAELAADDPHALAGVCETLLRQRKVADAQAPCARAIRELSPRLRLILFHAEEAKDYPLALSAAEQGLIAEPASPYFRSDRTRILHQMGRAADAEVLLRQYVAEQPNDWGAVEELADYLYGQGELGDARALYLRLVDPRCPYDGLTCTVRGNLAVASLRLGMLDDAFRHLEAALEHQIDCPGLLSTFREHAQARSDSASVLARLRRTLGGISDTVAARHGAGGAADYFATIGDWERAAHYYRIALDSAVAREREGTPGRFASGLRWEYGRALVEQGRFCDGRRELMAAQAADPIFENGRPHLTSALARAKDRCREEGR